jgi:16S rRNA (uracil1498-N3)-methyltransferase
MASYDFSAPRLYIDAALAAGVVLALDRNQHNYLCNVLRLSEGDTVLVFNGRDGEWRAAVAPTGRKQIALHLKDQVRPQTPANDLHYLFAPLKHARLDYMVQKAVEMGVTCLRPVITRRTQASRVNEDRMRANVIEAAEQCGIIALPEVRRPEPLEAVTRTWPQDRTLVFCDEDAEGETAAVHALSERAGSFAVLIGPEGGFDPGERAMLLACPNVLRLNLGPRILRADTAAVAALTLVQALAGDWRPAR